MMRIGIATVVVSLLSIGIALSDVTAAAARREIHIPAEGLAPALQQFAKLRGVHIVFIPAEVKDAETQGVDGELDLRESLERILKGTQLTYKVFDDSSIGIFPLRTGRNSTLGFDGGAGTDYVPVSLLQDAGQSSHDAASAADKRRLTSGESTESSQSLSEIIVTAEKRSERLQDVPVPVTAINADALVERNQLRIEDYYTSVPGLSVTPGDEHGAPQLTIRGLTTGGFTNSTVGIVIDDVPFGATVGGYSSEVPDIDPSELARVEVLRGPQGTLYGASSMGGLLKFVTIDPAFDAVSGRVQAGVSGIDHGDGPGYSVRGAINVPLSDTLAVRASAFARHDPGYIDDPVLHINGVNWGDVNGGRLSALWRPSSAFAWKLSALLQHSEVHGSPDVDIQPGLGDLQQSAVRGSGWRNKQIEAFSSTMTAKVGVADLTVLTGYNIIADSDSYDYSGALGGTTQTQFGVGGAPLLEHLKTRKFTQEVRLSIPLGDRIDWLLGAFYNHEDNPETQDILAADPASGAVVGEFLHVNYPSTFAEYAGFTDLTFHFTERFDVQLGARESQNRQTLLEGLAFGPTLAGVSSTTDYPKAYVNGNSFTYLVTPRFKISPDLMIYARLASGYRPGGPNINTPGAGLPLSYKPDTTENFEVGVKGDVLHHLLSFDASVYYINWKDIQLQLRDPTTAFTYYANGGHAKSQGVELSVQSRPVTGLTIASWIAFNDAVLTQTFPVTSTAYGAEGDRLPNSSRFSGNVSVDQEFALSGTITGFVGGALSYVGDRISTFQSTPQRQVFPAYEKTDLRAGVRYDSWAIDLFANNVADKRAALAGGIGSLNPNAFYYIQPRTVGMSLSKKF